MVWGAGGGNVVITRDPSISKTERMALTKKPDFLKFTNIKKAHIDEY